MRQRELNIDSKYVDRNLDRALEMRQIPLHFLESQAALPFLVVRA